MITRKLKLDEDYVWRSIVLEDPTLDSIFTSEEIRAACMNYAPHLANVINSYFTDGFASDNLILWKLNTPINSIYSQTGKQIYILTIRINSSASVTLVKGGYRNYSNNTWLYMSGYTVFHPTSIFHSNVQLNDFATRCIKPVYKELSNDINGLFLNKAGILKTTPLSLIIPDQIPTIVRDMRSYRENCGYLTLGITRRYNMGNTPTSCSNEIYIRVSFDPNGRNFPPDSRPDKILYQARRKCKPTDSNQLVSKLINELIGITYKSLANDINKIFLE